MQASVLIIEKWVADELEPPTGAAFNPALMAAMSWPWPLFAIPRPQVVAAGMTPPDNLPP